jgi:hypothetical protein
VVRAVFAQETVLSSPKDEPEHIDPLVEHTAAASVLYLVVALIIVFVVAIISGLIAFGIHPIVTPTISFGAGHLLWLTFIAYVLQL